MATVATTLPHVALNLKVPGNFGATDAPNSKNARPLYLASHGIRGKVILKYDSSTLPIQCEDVVKVTLSGEFISRLYLSIAHVAGSSSTRKPRKGPGMALQYTQLQSSV